MARLKGTTRTLREVAEEYLERCKQELTGNAYERRRSFAQWELVRRLGDVLLPNIRGS